LTETPYVVLVCTYWTFENPIVGPPNRTHVVFVLRQMRKSEGYLKVLSFRLSFFATHAPDNEFLLSMATYSSVVLL